MKRFFSVFFVCLIIILPIFSFVSCGSAESGENEVEYNGTINVYNWGEYISDGSEDSLDVNAEFTAKRE